MTNHKIYLLILSIFAATISLTVSYSTRLTPQNHYNTFQKIYPDNWIESHATITLPHLAARGNRLLFDFDGWRPDAAPAELEFTVCGEANSRVSIGASSVKHLLALRGYCEPFVVEIAALNTFSPSSADTRSLAVRLRSVEITSRFGLPILSPLFLGKIALAIALVAIVLFLSLTSPWRYSAYLVPIAAFFLLNNASYYNIGMLEPLWLLAICMACGAYIAARLAPTALAGCLNSFTKPGLILGREGGLHWILLAAILVIGTALRFYGLNFGLPSNFHPDEVPKVNAIMNMVNHGDLNPRYFLHPSLLLYSTYGMNNLFHFFGVVGEFRDTAFLAGRTVSAIAGSLSILLVYLVGSNINSARSGILGAAILAVMPLHVTCSRYLKEDALLTFLILATALAVIKAVKEDRRGLLFLAAIIAGCAASTKYSGLLAGAIVCAAPWLKSRDWLPDRRYFITTFCAMFLMPIAFIICSPYSVLTPAKFIKDFSSEKHHMMRGHTMTISAWSQYWMYHLSRSIEKGMSIFTTVIALTGIGLLLRRRRTEDLFLVGLILLFYLPAEWVKAKPEPQPERYIVPCLPFLALITAEFIRSISYSRLKTMVPFLSLAILFFPAKRTFELASEVPNDTRLQAAAWMRENLPANSKVYLDWKPYAPRFFNNEFNVEYIMRSRIMEYLDIKKLKNSGYDYLVLSSLFYERYFTQPQGQAAARDRLRRVFKSVPIAQEFAPKYGTYGFNNPVVTVFSLKQEDFAKLEDELRLKQSGDIDRTSNEMRAAFRWAK